MEFDPILLSRARLGVISVLIARESATFPELKELLRLTQGNLGIHLTRLEEAGYVSVTKSFVDRMSCTTARITRKWRNVFLRHIEQLEQAAKIARRKPR